MHESQNVAVVVEEPKQVVAVEADVIDFTTAADVISADVIDFSQVEVVPEPEKEPSIT